MPITGENRMAYLATHKADMLLSVGQTPEREKILDFSRPYAPYYLAVFGPKSLPVKSAADLAGKTISVARGTLEDLSVSKVAPPSATIKRFDDPNGAISAFLSGQAQLMVVGNDVGATIIARNPPIQPEQKFELFSSPDHVGLNKNEPRLLKEVDAAIAAGEEGRHAEYAFDEMAEGALSGGSLRFRVFGGAGSRLRFSGPATPLTRASRSGANCLPAFFRCQ